MSEHSTGLEVITDYRVLIKERNNLGRLHTGGVLRKDGLT